VGALLAAENIDRWGWGGRRKQEAGHHDPWASPDEVRSAPVLRHPVAERRQNLKTIVELARRSVALIHAAADVSAPNQSEAEAAIYHWFGRVLGQDSQRPSFIIQPARCSPWWAAATASPSRSARSTRSSASMSPNGLHRQRQIISTESIYRCRQPRDGADRGSTGM